MRLAKEGRIIVYPFTIINFGLIYLYHLELLQLAVIAITMLLYFFCLNFFRDPIRSLPKSQKNITSPADGKIIRIEKITDDEIGDSKIISIFLNVFDVHVNRMPIKGKFINIDYQKGRFLMAFKHDAADENERNIINISTEAGEIKIIQIAGLIARRIICYAKKNKHMNQGDRLGFMRFGSRIDIIVPESVKLQIEVGQKVMGNNTIIGTFR